MTQHEISHKCVRILGLVVTLINIRFDYEQLKHEYTFLGYLIGYRADIPPLEQNNRLHEYVEHVV